MHVHSSAIQPRSDKCQINILGKFSLGVPIVLGVLRVSSRNLSGFPYSPRSYDALVIDGHPRRPIFTLPQPACAKRHTCYVIRHHGVSDNLELSAPSCEEPGQRLIEIYAMSDTLKQLGYVLCYFREQSLLACVSPILFATRRLGIRWAQGVDHYAEEQGLGSVSSVLDHCRIQVRPS